MSTNKKPVEIKIECTSIKAGSPASVGLMVEVNAPEAAATTITRPAKGIVFVVDRSGSMGGGRLELVKQSMLDTVGRVSKDDYLAVVAFDNMIDIVLPMTKVGNMQLKDVRKKIQDLDPRGGTNLEVGFRYGLAEATRAPKGVEVQVILLSDGAANQGIVDPVELGKLAAAATEHLISTSTVGIGERYDENILVALSNTGNGNHFAAVRQEEASVGLEAEIDGLLARTMGDIEVWVHVDEEFKRGKGIRSIQKPKSLKLETGSANFSFGELASLEERNFVFELTTGSNPVSTKRFAYVAVDVSYTDLVTGQRGGYGQKYEIEVIDPANWVEPARDEDIVMELANLRAQDTKERAIELMRAGRDAEARELLQQIGAGLEELEALSYNMSTRNRARARAQRQEFYDLSMMESEEFIKRGEESLKRGRESKPDPRKRDQGDI